MSAKTAQSQRDYALDALKVIAILCIVFHHYQQDTGVYFEGGFNFVEGFYPFAYVVELFFMLSGLFMYHYIPKIGTQYTFKRFYLKRALRLLPIVAIAAVVFEILVVAYPYICGQQLDDQTLNIGGMVIDALGVQAGWIFKNPHVNNPTWYVSVLLLCYAVFYLATWVAHKIHVRPEIFYGIIIVVGITVQVHQWEWPFLNGLAARGYLSFFFGLLIGPLLQKDAIRSIPVQVISAIAAVGIIVYLMRHPFFEPVQYLLVFFFYPALLALLRNPLAAKICRFPVIETLSKVSFNVYVWHDMLWYAINAFVVAAGCQAVYHSYLTMLAFALASFCVGGLSYRFLEQPITNALKQHTHLLD